MAIRSVEEDMDRMSLVRLLIWSTQSVHTGQQYREDSGYVGRSMEAFHQRADRLRTAMDEIAGSIASISGAIDGAASGLTGAPPSRRPTGAAASWGTSAIRI